MQPGVGRELGRRFAAQHGVLARAELRALGVDFHNERRRLQSGDWARAGKRVVRLAAAPVTPQQRLMAACLEAGKGAVASHQSAAWLWGLIDAPARHAVTVPRGVRQTVAWADVHRPKDPPDAVLSRSGIPCTGVPRTLVDLAGVFTAGALDGALDRALASKLVTVPRLVSELERLARPGRPGIGPLRAALRRRGYVGAENPSVLESRTLRLLHVAGLRPLATEVRVGESGRYRIDILVAPRLVVEVDGFAYHHSPEQKSHDERRRNRLRLDGFFVLVYGWRDVTQDGQRVIAEIRAAIGDLSSGAYPPRKRGVRGPAREAPATAPPPAADTRRSR